MESLPPEFFEALIHVGGAPLAIGVIIYYLWTHGPGKDYARMMEDIREIKSAQKAESTARFALSERTSRLEIIAEHLLKEL